MQLVKVTVNAFQCIEEADVDLGPGLNVLYGPNDLGKSSLASAIRAVLLLPHGSSAHEALVSWHSGDAPRVALVFKTEEHRFWRVRKTFGGGSAGSSALEFSKDGSSFSVECTGRAVDARLRELLRWGLDKPGGRGGSKGFPESFLTNVLLAEQADVPKILARGLTQDPDESGRARLNEALQALAQDPLFKRVLDEAQAHVAQAFTSKGQRSARKGSPFQEVTGEINELRSQQNALQTKLKETLGAEASLQSLHGDLDILTARLSEEKEALGKLVEGRARTLARAVIDEELRIARKALADIKAEFAEVDQAARAVETLQGELSTAETTLIEKATAEKDAALVHDQARDRFQDATSEQGAQERQLRRQHLENDRHKGKERRAEIQATVGAAAEAERQGNEAEKAKRALGDVAGELTRAEESAASLAKEEKSARDEVERLKLIEAFGRLEDARRKLAVAREAEAAAHADGVKAAKLRDEAEKLEQQVSELAVPDAEVVKALRALSQEVEVAEARLGGGLSVVLNPRKNIRVQVAVDGAEASEHRGRDPLTLEAQRSILLRVDALLDVTITAGEAAARTQVEKLRKRWAEESAPVLARARVADVARLEEARREADNLARRAAEQRTEAQELERRVKEHQERTRALEVVQRRVAELEQTLMNYDHGALAVQLTELGDSWESEVERRRVSAETTGKESAGELGIARSRVTELTTRLAERETAYQKTRESAGRALEAFPQGLAIVLDQGCRELEELDHAIADLTQRIDSFANEAQLQETEAQQGLEKAARQFQDAIKARKNAETIRTEKREALAKATGTLETVTKQAAKLDTDAAENTIANIEARLAEVPEASVTEEDVQAAHNQVRTTERAVVEKQAEIHKAQGGLEQVGGAVIREQKEEIDRALHIALEREHEVEVDSEAWKLLAEILRDVENTDGAHLGKALSGPLGARFKELTGNRYGSLDIGPHLKTDGVQAGGQLRPYDAFSVGTQDQLATLFRLCIAEQLHHAIVLDDHLSQSDPEKIKWFGALLRRTGQEIQVVLLTCRAEDYLLPGEFPGAEDIERDLAGGSLHVVNLARAIRRYSLAAVAASRAPR